MKKLAIILLMAVGIMGSAYGQNDPVSLSRLQNGTDTGKTLLSQFKAKATYVPRVATDRETISTLNYTVTGKYVAVVTAARKDTIRLTRASYINGQEFNFICTNAANDSTIIIPNLGNINGASTYWWTGTYKTLTLYFNGTDYFIKSKQ